MSYSYDKEIGLKTDRDWCGCPIVDGLTAHLCGVRVSEESDLTNPVKDLDEGADVLSEGADEGTPDKPYGIPEPVRTARGYLCSKGADEGLVIVGEAGAYGGTIRDLCFDLENGHYAGEAYVTGVWRISDTRNGDLVKCKIDIGWPRPGHAADWPVADIGTVTVSIIGVPDPGYTGLTLVTGNVVHAHASFMIDGRA